MRYGVITILIITLIMFLAQSCGQATVEYRTRTVYVPVSCPIPDIPKAQLEQIKKEDDYATVLNKLIHNYGLLKEENVKLWEIVNTCKNFEPENQNK